MEVFNTRYCLSLLLLTSIGTNAGSNETSLEEPREPRVIGRIVKLYSGAKPEPYLCSSEGFQPDPSNCAVFYRCVKERSGKFTVFRYQCAPGTVYDPDVEICNHPRSTRRTECGGMRKPAADASHSTNLNEIDEAQPEVPRPISTKVPIYTEQTTFRNDITWILTTERQNIPTKMPLGAIINNTDATQHKTNTISGTSTGYGWSSPADQMQKSPPKTTLLKNDPCTSDGFMGDSDNCRKFYRCVGNQRRGFIKYEFSCSESTVWDDEIQGCNHPWAVKRSECGRSMSFDETSSSTIIGTIPTEGTTKEQDINNGGYGYKTIQQQLQISHGSQVTQTQTQISNSGQVIQNQTQINYGDKMVNIKNSESKQNQTQLSHGAAVSQTQTQIDYGNKGVQTQLQIDHSKESSQSQTQIQGSTTAQSATSAQINNIGNNVCFKSGFMGDANDCKKFYRCVENSKGTYTKYDFSCGDGTVWDPEIEVCNHAWAVKNCGGTLPSKPTSEESSTTTKRSTEHHTEPTKTTQSYYTTSQVSDVDDEHDVGYGNQNNQETTSSSITIKPSTTTTFKPSTTMSPTTTTTEKINGDTIDCTSSGFMGDVNDCKIFYRCVDNGRGGFTKYEFKCGDGTLWDSDIEACNHAWAVKNCGGSTTGNVNLEETTTKKEDTTPHHNVQTTVTLIQVTTQASTQNDDYDTVYGSQNQEPAGTITSTKQPQVQESDKNSECKYGGFMGDEKDCKKFYRCVDNGSGGYIQYEFACGEGTVWDPKIEACNHAWAVKKCGGSNNVIENIETTSQSTSTTNYVDTSSAYTTEENKDTDKPVVTTTTSTTSSITTSSSTNDKCSQSGFMGDSNDCKKFYRCVDNGDGTYIRYEFTCGEGTVWDPKIEGCNHAWAVEKCGGISESTHATQQTTSQHPVLQDEQENGYATPSYETSDSSQTTSTMSSSSTPITSGENDRCYKSGFKGDKNNCKKFYRCVDNGKGGYDRYEFQCGEGTVWDGSIEACNHAWAVKDCGSTDSSTIHVVQNESTTQSISSSVANEDGQTQHFTEKTTTIIQTNHESEVAGEKCMQEGFFGNKKDCKMFYRCVDNGKGGFIKYDFTCGEGTSWNQDIQGCDHTSPDRPCGVMSQEPSYLNDDMDDQTISPTKATTSTEESGSTEATKKPQISLGTCESEGFYENSSDCKKFYRCVANGYGGYTKYDFNCGDGTVWNQEIQACGHESVDKKCAGNSSNQNQGTESQSESTTIPYSTTKKQETTYKTESPETAGNICKSEGFFSHPHNCKKFIRCVSNDKGGYLQYEFSCGDGTIWVQDIQACDHDNDDNSCSAQTGSTSIPQNTEEHSSGSSDSGITSSTESITPSREDDEYNNWTPKEPSHDETDDCTSEGYFANQQDCRRFYRCVDNGNGGYTKYDFVCGEGTAWDSGLQTCNHIHEVQSCSGSSHVQTTTKKNQAATENTSSTTKATTSSSESSFVDSSSSSQDTCESQGFFGDSKDCKKFYRCVDNGKGSYTKYDFTCGDGTIWDKDIISCNHPQDVSNPSCSSDQGSGASSTSTTTISQATSNSTESSSSSQGTSDCSQESSKKPTNNNVTCEKAGYYANPSDCKKFYRCVDWDGDGIRFSIFHFECGEGTIWDPALNTCNHEDSVYPQRDCSKKPSQSVGGETTTVKGTTSTEPTTDEQTTQESIAGEHTTQPSTTSEQITVQQSTTSEQTTTEQTTSEQTTTQQSTTTTSEPTTSEQTTTQQSTTSEKTTTQESTTNEQTTTQQVTTSEQTTTQQSTTEQSIDEQTTTKQSTTSEKTTTLEPITSEQTTPPSPTSELTTTQESTTSEKTTTQQSTSSEPTTTQQSTTNEQTTTEQSTNEQTTTQQSTTSETTTQQSTTSEQTTQESTTSEPTTTQQSNEQTTEESTTTTVSVTEGTTTIEETTNQSTTQTSSTEYDSTEDQSTTKSPETTVEVSSSDNCPEIEDDQYLLVCPTSFKRHPKYCNMFYQCIEDDETYEAKVAMFKCPNNTIYDESLIQCVAEEKADKKCDGEIANKRRFKRLGINYKDPILADKGKQSCSTAGYFSFEKESECSKGFLKCEKSKNGPIRGHVYQCPDGYIYWSISKRCESIESVRDCKLSSNDWTGRWNIPVERKNIAPR